jgi:Tol biopolymer transport system component
MRIAAQGGMPETLATMEGQVRPAQHLSWAPDGRNLVLRLGANATTGSDIAIVRLDQPKLQIELLLAGPANEQAPSISPDSKWLSYDSNENGRYEVYVQPFPDLGRKYQVSVNGGQYPIWSGDGRELYFISPDGRMMAVAVRNTGANLEFDTPKQLFDAKLTTLGTAFNYSVSKDGRFLIPMPETSEALPLTLVLNWPAALKK